MSLRGKLNALAVGIALFVGAASTLLTLTREYHVGVEQRFATFNSSVLNSAGLLLFTRSGDADQLAATLDLALPQAGIAYAEVYDDRGLSIIRRGQPASASGPAPSFAALRNGAPTSDPVEISLDRLGRPVSNIWLFPLPGSERFSHLTTPLFASRQVHENRPAGNRSPSVDEPLQPSVSPVVIGYLHVAINDRELMTGLAPGLVSLVSTTGLLVVVSVLLAGLIIRRLTYPLERLNAYAAELLDGRLDAAPKCGDIGELSDISKVLEMAVNQQASMAQNSSDHDISNAELESRVAELSCRNTELGDEVRESTKSRDALWHFAYFDSLTALPNRRHFLDYLERVLHLGQRNGDQIALLFLDLNNFKQVNDSFGHTTGDALLKEFAMRLSGCIRESDMVGFNIESGSRVDVSRLGGDEFAILLSQVETPRSAGVVAQRIIEKLAEPILVENQTVSVAVSIGIALAPGDASDPEGLIRAADTAMYYAKRLGHSGFSYYQNHMDEPRMDQVRMKTDLREAVLREELVLHYQPQVDVRNGTIVGAEALLRWNHPELGFIPPLQFIPLAEEMDIISELGRWTLQETCRQLTEFELMGLKLPRVTVNVSALQFNAEFISMVKTTLGASGIDPSRLQLELTEGAIITDVGGTIRALQELKEIGVGLSMDDFGTGYSPLSYLSRFPLDELKIDRHFVARSRESETDANLVTGFIAMAKCMKLRLIATGVESPEQFDFLVSNGAYILQGYLFSEPVGAAQLASLLAPWHFMEQVVDLTNDFDKASLASNAKALPCN